MRRNYTSIAISVLKYFKNDVLSPKFSKAQSCYQRSSEVSLRKEEDLGQLNRADSPKILEKLFNYNLFKDKKSC